MLSHAVRIILEKYVFNQASHGLLVVVWSIFNACPYEPLLGPGPEPLNRVELGAIGSIEDQLYSKLARKVCRFFRPVYAEIIK